MQQLIKAYDLEIVDYLYHRHIATKRIKAVYNSSGFSWGYGDKELFRNVLGK